VTLPNGKIKDWDYPSPLLFRWSPSIVFLGYDRCKPIPREKIMERLAQTKDFCPNPACPDYGKVQSGKAQSNLKKIGHTPRGVQRCQCKTCGKTFTVTKGTLFYRKHAREDEILEVLALLAEGTRISTLTRVKGIKEDTVLRWLREAARHADQVDAVLLKDFRLKRAQLDGLWSFVGNKGEKKLSGDC
jgi:transposase-like protein